MARIQLSGVKTLGALAFALGCAATAARAQSADGFFRNKLVTIYIAAPLAGASTSARAFYRAISASICLAIHR